MDSLLNRRIIVRRVGNPGDEKRWGIPNDELTGWEEKIYWGLLFDATLDATVPIMNNEECHGGCCFGEASGVYKDFVRDFPKEDQIERRFEIGYDPRKKMFYNKSNSKEPVGHVDILVLFGKEAHCHAIFLKK
jgi:hypothetical protein